MPQSKNDLLVDDELTNNQNAFDTNANLKPSPQIKSFLSVSKILIFVALLLIISAVAIFAYYIRGQTNQKTTTTTAQVPVVTNTVSPINIQISPTIISDSSNLFSGHLKRIDKNLMIFKQTEDDKLNNVENNFVYYEAGVFSRGEYAGFTRVIALRDGVGPSGPKTYILATKDFQTYVLNDPNQTATKYQDSDYESPYYFLDKTKIKSTAILDGEFKPELSLNQDFSLFADSFPTISHQTTMTDKNGNKIDETLLATDTTALQKMSSPYKNLTLFFQKDNFDSIYLDQKNELLKLKKQYVQGSTDILVVDSTGLPYLYNLTTPVNIKNYYNQNADYSNKLVKYQEQVKQYNDKQITNYPDYPLLPHYPNLDLENSQIISQPENKFFKVYSSAFPLMCANRFNAAVVKVNDDELEQVGTISNLPIYKLKDKNHPLYTLAYRNKMDKFENGLIYNVGDKTSHPKPSLEEYVAENPLLFFKDYWDRWVAVGEFDVITSDGCGKPVIYLYPTQPTQVNVQFLAPVQFGVDIPKYGDGWSVLAQPSGDLTNLKPQLTDCSRLDFDQKGSEYARRACQNNVYPYLYWAGNINSIDYPEVTTCWIVAKDQINDFLHQKLSHAGLNTQEISDFTSYWVPEILSKNAPYYRISFLQTAELNRMFPMKVTPQPNTVYRLFLDYLPMTSKPNQTIDPPDLFKLVRRGFTLVEWGGLKR